MSSADVMDAKQWSIDVYGRHVQIKPVVHVTDEGSMQIPISGGETSIFSTTDADIEMEQTYDSMLAAIRYRPHDGLTYRIKAGTINNFELEYSSGTHSNKLSAMKNGFVWGLGAEWNVSPGTIVSPAITFDASFTQTHVKLDRFQSPDVNVSASNSLDQGDIQLAVNISKRFKRVEPFGGLKVNRVVTQLKDDATKERIKGTKDGWAPFVGVQYEFFPGEMIVIEGSFVDEESITAGLRLRF